MKGDFKMWSIKEVKQKGKVAMKANYWMTFAVSLLMMVLIGGGGGSVARSVHSTVDQQLDIKNGVENVSGNENNGAVGEAGNIASEIVENINDMSDMEIAALITMLMTVFAAITVLSIFYTCFNLLITKPLEVGFMNFFVKNSEAPAAFGEIKRAFSPSWMGNVLTMFLRSLYLFLWTMLFIIPGCVKIYSYALVPYIRAERPELGANETITLSRKLMNGNKFRMFLFDISFIGWEILALLTCGILNAFYVMPYYNCSKAEIYRSILSENAGEY